MAIVRRILITVIFDVKFITILITTPNSFWLLCSLSPVSLVRFPTFLSFLPSTQNQPVNNLIHEAYPLLDFLDMFSSLSNFFHLKIMVLPRQTSCIYYHVFNFISQFGIYSSTSMIAVVALDRFLHIFSMQNYNSVYTFQAVVCNSSTFDSIPRICNSHIMYNQRASGCW